MLGWACLYCTIGHFSEVYEHKSLPTWDNILPTISLQFTMYCLKIYLKESTSHHIIDVIRTVYRVQNAIFNIVSHVRQIIYPNTAEIASFGYL